MYTLESAKAVAALPGSRWSTVNLTNTPIANIYFQYRRIILTLRNSFDNGVYWLDMEDVRNTIALAQGTIGEWLTSIGNTTIPVKTVEPVINTKTVQFKDAFMAGYTCQPIVAGQSINSSTPMSLRNDLALTREDTDFNNFSDYCLTTVNGFIHYNDNDGTKAVILDAMKSLRKANQNHVGVISFESVGKIHKYQITENMIYREESIDPDTGLVIGEGLGGKALIKLPADLSERVVMFVIGGYLHLPGDKLISQVNDGTFSVNFGDWHLRDRIIEMSQYLDLTELNLVHSVNNPDMYNIDNLKHDDTIKALLTMSQSFIVALDSRDFFVNRHKVQNSNLPGVYTYHQKPIWPLAVGYGKLSEYWYTYEDTHYNVTVSADYEYGRNYRTFDRNANPVNFTNQNIPGMRYFHSRAEFIELGRDIVSDRPFNAPDPLNPSGSPSSISFIDSTVAPSTKPSVYGTVDQIDAGKIVRVHFRQNERVLVVDTVVGMDYHFTATCPLDLLQGPYTVKAIVEDRDGFYINQTEVFNLV
ncbi:MAG: hypothetical protein E6Q68_06850 [Polynucleobacter sp.]|nr:MAG: hypothetical protein E6Q68_06850 [Polynucleobacter sp.]